MSALVLAVLAFIAGCSSAAGVASSTTGRTASTTTAGTQQHGTTSLPAPSWRWLRALALAGSSSAAAVDCTSARFCMVAESSGPTYRYEDGKWSGSEAAPRLSRRPAGVSLSCATASFCMLTTVGGDGVDRWDGRHWSKIVIAGARPLWAIACSSASFCVTVDGIGDAYYWDGSGFSAGDPDWGSQVAISCTNPAFCVAVAGGVSQWQGSGWSEPQTFSASAAMTGVSCLRERFCMVVDAGGEFLLFDGRGWTRAVVMRSGDGVALGRSVALTDVSCASARACVATGRDGAAFRWNGRAWSGPVEVSAGRPLTAVSCPTLHFCAATGGGSVFLWKKT